jgi:hypothetical protein
MSDRFGNESSKQDSIAALTISNDLANTLHGLMHLDPPGYWYCVFCWKVCFLQGLGRLE